MTGLRLNKAHYPVTALGPGRRAGIWVQGCSIGCAGCMSKDTWEADPGTEVPVAAVLGWLDSIDGDVDGITISGGEPFQQAAAVTELLKGIHSWRGAKDADILAYSGYAYSRLTRFAESRAILDLCDAVVTGPYLAGRADGSPLRGSANQRLVPLTELGWARYGTEDEQAQGRQVQVSVTDGPEGRRVYYIGIPGRGDMERLTASLERAGVRAGDVSWR